MAATVRMGSASFILTVEPISILEIVRGFRDADCSGFWPLLCATRCHKPAVLQANVETRSEIQTSKSV